MSTIQHDNMAFSPGYPRQIQSTGFSQPNLRTQEFGPGGPVNQVANRQSRELLTPNRGTHYSQRDVEEARGSLHLLKKRMSNSRERMMRTGTIENAASYSTGGPKSNSVRNSSHQNGVSREYGLSNPNQGQFNHVPKPPRVNQSYTQEF